jgi:hypothetical protein
MTNTRSFQAVSLSSAVADLILVRHHAARLGTASRYFILWLALAIGSWWLIRSQPDAASKTIWFRRSMIALVVLVLASWSAFCSCVRRLVRRGNVLCHVRSDRSAHCVVHHRYHVFLSGVRARVAKSQHLRTHVSLSALRPQTQTCLTNRWSQPLAGVLKS